MERDNKWMSSETDLVERVSEIVSSITGVQLGPSRRSMVLSRIHRRMGKLGLKSPAEYLDYLQEHLKLEVDALVSLLTTHHTHFFREFAHFEFLSSTALPALVAAKRSKGEEKKIRVWSAACSRGQEVYSLAMYLKQHLGRMAPDFKFEIFGSDVDRESVEIAKNGVYLWDELKEAPAIYLSGNWSRGTGDIAAYARVKNELRSYCQFAPVNLIEAPFKGVQGTFDLIFCRNVFIYFTPEQVRSATQNLLKHLQPEGYFFVGLSESLINSGCPVNYAGPSVYSTLQNSGTKTAPKPTAALQPAPLRTVTAAAPQVSSTRPLRVLCVDDSPTVISLLKKILNADNGFEIVATAGDGEQAAQVLAKQKIDVMTLDIHMPVLSGVDYLKKYGHRADHPAVVMVTSVSREDAELGVKSLELGASDYVEKPTLTNLTERGEELRNKLRTAFESRQTTGGRTIELDRAFQRPVKSADPQKSIRLIVAGISDRERLKQMLEQVGPQDPPTFVLLDGAHALLESLSTLFTLKNSVKFAPLSDAAPQPGQLFLADFGKHFGEIKNRFQGKKAVSILVMGQPSKQMGSKLAEGWTQSELILEDVPGEVPEGRKLIMSRASHIIPLTSFLYHSAEFLASAA